MRWSGRKTVTVVGSPEALAPPGISGQCWIQSETDNTGFIAIGGAPKKRWPDGRTIQNGPRATEGVQEGFILRKEQSLPFTVEISEVWIDASVAGDGVTWAVL